MPNDPTSRKPFEPSISALWFTREGMGPDLLAIQLRSFPSQLGGKIGPALGLRIEQCDELNLNAREMVGGGFLLDREQVRELHSQLGEWLSGDVIDPKVR